MSSRKTRGHISARKLALLVLLVPGSQIVLSQTPRGAMVAWGLNEYGQANVTPPNSGPGNHLSATDRSLAKCEIHQDVKLTASDATAGAIFGYSVSVSGDVAIVGASNQACTAGYSCGAAYVWRFNGSAWVEEQKLTASDAAADDRFGSSVSVSGNVAVVGAWRDDCAAGDSCGSAYVYRFAPGPPGHWVEEAKLVASDPALNDSFGISVSVAGDVTVVGASQDDCGARIDCGAAYVYRFNGSTWFLQARLTATDAAQDDYFGYSVSVDGDVAIVGAIGKDCRAGIDCGVGYVYRLNGSNWVEEAKLTASDATAGDQFSLPVSVSGDVAVIGARRHACAGGIDCGAAYVYRFNGNTWIEEQKVTAPDATAGDYFGSASVSEDTVVVGATNQNCAAGQNCGAAYVYRFNGSTWGVQGKLTTSEPVQNDTFGFATSVSRDVAVVGAGNHACAAGSSCGAAYVYTLGLPLCDCNNNGVPDDIEIAECAGDPACADSNNNAIPDECDECLFDEDCEDGFFCNGEEMCRRGTCARGLSSCQVAEACDEEHDECLADCNRNGLPDVTDIGFGTSRDCNANQIPDECEPDNDGDGVVNGCDSCPATPAGLIVGAGGCPLPFGPCCFGGEICIDTTEGDVCKRVRGRYLGDGLTCAGDPDGDGILGCADECPLDREKAEPGICGCGVSDVDSDRDSVPDCLDQCAGTPAGVAVNDCGCPARGACCFAVGGCFRACQ